ncbi:MAG: InlB B-repeat-containing protein [Solirubrobacteraceae bacterium]
MSVAYHASRTVCRRLIAGALVTVGLAAGVPVAHADTTVVGDLSLAAQSADLDALGNTPVFQGAALAGSYALNSTVNGTITAWSFRSGPNSAAGDHFVLRVMRPADAFGSMWQAVGTSSQGNVTNLGGGGAVQGPFDTNLPIQSGDRIALEPVGSGNTPIVLTGNNGSDGIRYFNGPVADNSTATIAPGADINNGQVVPIQATVTFTPAPPVRTLHVTTSGAGSGTVSGPGIDCGGGPAHTACSTSVANGTQLALTATSLAGSRFSGFSGGGCATASPCTVTMTSDMSIDARFDVVQPRLTPIRLDLFSLRPSGFVSAPLPPTVRPTGVPSKWGTQLRFRLSAGAIVDYQVDECLSKPQNVRHTSCYHPQSRGTFTTRSRRGLNRVAFTGYMMRVARSRSRRQGFVGSELFPGHYRLLVRARASPIHTQSASLLRYFTVLDEPPTLTGVALSRNAITERSNGANGSGITVFYSHTFRRPSAAKDAELVRKILNIEILYCGDFRSTGCDHPTRSAYFVTVDAASGTNQFDLTHYINGSAGGTLLGSGRYRLVLSASGCAPIHADFAVYSKTISFGDLRALSLSRYSFPAAPSGGVTGPPDFSSDFGTVVSFYEDRNYGHSEWTDVFHVFDSYGRWVAAIVVHATAGRHKFYWSGISDLGDAAGPLPPGPYVMVQEEYPGRIVYRLNFTITRYNVGHT